MNREIFLTRLPAPRKVLNVLSLHLVAEMIQMILFIEMDFRILH